MSASATQGGHNECAAMKLCNIDLPFQASARYLDVFMCAAKTFKPECRTMSNVMAALPNIGCALCSTPQFGWRWLLDCRAVRLPRRETRWNLQGCPKLPDRSQPLIDRSSPYYGDIWGRYGCFTSFFPIVDMCLNWEDIARQSCGMVPRMATFWRFFACCIFSEPRTHVSDLYSKLTLRPHHVWKYM